MSKYTIGIDYGSLSGRAVLVRCDTGEVVAESTMDYPHAVMDTALSDGTPLGQDWALQDPQDYLDVLCTVVPAVLRESGVAAEDVIGVGTDFTACTVLPVKADGTPLCFLPQFRSTPNAYVKLWKHHAAEKYAARVTEIAAQRGESFLQRYGGKISSEWEIPKIWQILDESPEVYEAADHIVEGGDWIVWQLTGVLRKNTCAAGYKGTWSASEGYPSEDFFKALDPRLSNYVSEKLNFPAAALGSAVGGVTEEMARRTGLRPGTPVSASIIDAHVAMPSAGITGPGQLLAIMGTSTCDILLSEEERMVPGMCGVVDGGVYPGYYAYEAGQSCVGDHFAWFVDRCCPAAYQEEADRQGKNLHVYLTELAETLQPGESGLIALDWWNGNRSVLTDYDLTGLIVGMTLTTRPEEIYRALIEATAYGTRMIVENFVRHGVPVTKFVATGGISQKNAMAMQIYADVLNMPVHIADGKQGGALGAACFAAVAAGKAAGGYDSITEAAAVMGRQRDTFYSPIPEHAAVYETLYREYSALHDYFGRGGSDVMKRLKAIRTKIKG